MPRKMPGQVSILDVDADPLTPDPETPTPLDLVMRLTKPQRETRVKRLVEQAWKRWDQTKDTLKTKKIAGVALLYSGGNDSSTIAHLFKDVATHVVHANTGTGIQATRDFVADTTASWDLPLLTGLPPEGQRYENIVRGEVYAKSKKTGDLERSYEPGFPGPAMHQVMYDRLKGRFLAQVPHILGISGSRTDRVVFIAGRRRAESQRREDVPFNEERGTVFWSSPIANWHKADLMAYRLMAAAAGDPVPHNPVTDVLGMSGECGCLAYAKGGERQKWIDAYPEDPFIRMILAVEEQIAERDDIADHRKKWGWAGDYRNAAGFVEEPSFGDLCGTSCGSDDRMLELMDPLFAMPARGTLRRSKQS